MKSNLFPAAYTVTRRSRGAVVPAGEDDSSVVVTLPRPGGRRPLRRQLSLHIRPLEAHEDAALPTVLTRTYCLTVLQQCFQCLIEECYILLIISNNQDIKSSVP